MPFFLYTVHPHIFCLQALWGFFNKLKALLIRAGPGLSSGDSIIYFVVKRPYDSILTLILRKVNKNTRILKNIFQRLIYFVHSIIRQYNTIQN